MLEHLENIVKLLHCPSPGYSGLRLTKISAQQGFGIRRYFVDDQSCDHARDIGTGGYPAIEMIEGVVVRSLVYGGIAVSGAAISLRMNLFYKVDKRRQQGDTLRGGFAPEIGERLAIETSQRPLSSFNRCWLSITSASKISQSPAVLCPRRKRTMR